MVELFFKFLRQLNHGIPTRWEVVHCMSLFDELDHVQLSVRIVDMMTMYMGGADISEIRTAHLVTYDRVVQCLIRGCAFAYGYKI